MSVLRIKDQDYRIDKISALKQFHVVRRLTPIISELIAAIAPKGAGAFKNIKASIENSDMSEITKHLPAIANSLAKLSDDEANYVIFSLLENVYRKSAGAWTKTTVGGTTLMYEDITMPIMLELAGRSLMVNLAGFMDALPSTLNEVQVPPKA